MKKKLTLSLAAAALSLASFNAAAAGHSIYAKAGFLGAGAGYAYGINEKFTIRGDFTTIGEINHSGSSSDFKYKGKLKNDVVTIYGDYFPFNNGFRFSAGLGLRNTEFKAHARPSGPAGTVTIGDATIQYGHNDHANAKVEFPDFAPYVGIGYGHNVGQSVKSGFAFIADAGVYIGKPKVSMNVSNSVRDKISALGMNADAEIDRQLKDIRHDANKVKAFPTLYVGVGYRF